MLKPTVSNPTQNSQLPLQCVCALLLGLNYSFSWAQTSGPTPLPNTSNPIIKFQSYDPKALGYRPKADVGTEEWLRRGPSHLEFAQHCMKQAIPNNDLVERIIRFTHARGYIETRELHQSLEKHKTPEGQAALVQLAPQQIAQSFKDMGITLDPTGFTAATYKILGRSVFYAVKNPDSCVLEIKTVYASLEPILSWGGWSNKYYSSPGSVRNEIMFPRIVKEIDSINIRTLQATWQDDKFTSRFVMRGNYGVDSEQLSRLELEQEYGRMRVVMSPALPEDLKRLGMDSSQSEWPVSESIETEINGFIGTALQPPNLKPTLPRWLKRFETGPFEMKPETWANVYLTESIKKQMPHTMYSPGAGAPVGLDKDLNVMFAAVPKRYDPVATDLLMRAFYLNRLSQQRSPYQEERGKGYMSIVIVPPKLNEGIAKGLATYRLESEPDGIRKTYEMIIKTKGALPDDKLLSFAQIRLMLPEELKANQPTGAKKVPVKR
jgi:hypothetical protein